MPYDQNNVFAKILRGELPNDTVFEDDEVLAFHDIYPQSKIHVLVIPKGNFVSFDDFTENATTEQVGKFFEKVGHIARDLDVDQEGFRIISNVSTFGGQEVPHFHVHICGGQKLGRMIEKK